MRITRVSNAGVLIETDKCTVLCDALHTDIVSPYPGPDMSLFEHRHIDVLCVTHAHPDHFRAPTAAAFLRARPDTAIVCGEMVRQQLADEGIPKNCFMGLSGERQGCIFECRSTRHIGPKFSEYEHYSIIIKADGITLLIAGDASPLASQLSIPADVLIAPYACALTDAGFRVVRDAIKPKLILIVHMPPEDNDPDGINGMLRHGADMTGFDVRVPEIGETAEIQ